MRRVVASEWVKFRRKGMFAALGGIIAVTVLGTVIAVFTVSSRTTTNPAGGGPLGGKSSIGFTQFVSSHGLADALGNAGTLLGVIVMGIVAASIAGEFSTGTLRNLRQASRTRLGHNPRCRRGIGGSDIGRSAGGFEQRTAHSRLGKLVWLWRYRWCHRGTCRCHARVGSARCRSRRRIPFSGCCGRGRCRLRPSLGEHPRGD
jgi:hypothetical protein